MSIEILSLSSCEWRFRESRRGIWHPAQVPGCVHKDLHRAGLIPDPFWGTHELSLQWIEERDWEYRTEFEIGGSLKGLERAELVADGLDTVARVELNGQLVACTDNMFQEYRWNVGRFLRPGRNHLVILFESAQRYARTHRKGFDPGEINDPLKRAPVIRKEQCQFGWDWGPRFVTAGIWRDIRLEFWKDNRLAAVRSTQTFLPDGAVQLSFHPELARRETGVLVRGTVSLEGTVVAKIEKGEARIPNPRLWWPAGQGTPTLYSVVVEVCHRDGEPIGTWEKRIGLRTIVLNRQPDAGGESFGFVVNGRPVFAKGANWIPAHSFVAGLTREDYARDLHAAVAANMNMIRVWGGGIYESEHFYDLCDELGLMVWQDFMFACAPYPGDRAFLRSVRVEAEQQVRRLRHRASLALWCGNNEVEQLNVKRLKKRRARASYDALFERLLPSIVGKLDGVTHYWPSSQHRPDGDNSLKAGERHGDTHYWEVWHARHPVKDYEKWRFRFCSEFGMQSYSSPQTNATFCAPEDNNILGPAMENHQKNRGGNQVILDYVSRRYRLPRTQEHLIYLSQLNQAYCIQTGVEHYRRLTPHCMGALYWQLNDCWPAASWSSIEHTGRWRALHHVARRFFGPMLVTARVEGDETAGIGNYRHSTVDRVELFTVCDDPVARQGMLSWDLFHLDGRRLLSGSRRVPVHPGSSRCWKVLSLRKWLEKHGRDSLYLRIALDVEGRRVSEETVFLTPPRFMPLPVARTRVSIRKVGTGRMELRFLSPVFQHRFCFDLAGVEHACSDNYFELYPGESKCVEITLKTPQTAAQLRRVLSFHSLVDTY